MALERATPKGVTSGLVAPGSPHALAFLKAAWPYAAGDELARRTEVVTLENGTLRLRVPDARWRKALHRMQRDILVRLREVAGGLAPHRLAFMEGAVAPPPERAKPPAPAAPPADTEGPPAAVLAAADAIPDPEIRSRFLETAARYLRRTR